MQVQQPMPEKLVLYEAKCTHSPNPTTEPKIYIGCTQQFLKKRMQQHVKGTRDLHQYLTGTRRHRPRSDTFSRYYAGLNLDTTTTPTPDAIRSLYTLKVLWQGNPTRSPSKLLAQMAAYYATKKDSTCSSTFGRNQVASSMNMMNYSAHAGTNQSSIGFPMHCHE